MTLYGITWANHDHSVAQTGYVYETADAARKAARSGLEGGPYVANLGTQVDGMCQHLEAECGVRYATIQTEEDDLETLEASK